MITTTTSWRPDCLSVSVTLPDSRLLIFCGHQSRHNRHPHITMRSQWARLRIKSPASRLFTHAFIPVQIKENIKAPSHWPLRGIHRWPMNSPHKGPVTRKMFPFDDVIINSVVFDRFGCHFIIRRESFLLYAVVLLYRTVSYKLYVQSG